MKTLFIAILVLCLTTLHAERSSVTAQGAFNQVLPAPPVQPVVLTPRDPYRIWDDKLYALTGVDERNGWVEFTGKIWNVQPAGVCIKGFYTGSGDGPDGDGVDFFVADFPYEVAEDESIGRNMRTLTFYLAKENGVYTYNTAVGGTKTLRKLEYGKIYVPPPPTPEQIAAAQAAAKAKAEAARKRAAELTLKFYQNRAAKGDTDAAKELAKLTNSPAQTNSPTK